VDFDLIKQLKTAHHQNIFNRVTKIDEEFDLK
jgi:hypothetical protein